ncbi:MAG: hypothetical protein K6F59_04930 [Gammaproteobacteria bacterium]|nr:hypothetical protein [Gammaproteobacteria bacterium]
MKRKLINIFSIIALVAVTMSLVSCYASKPGTLKQLVGTYELTKYTYSNTSQSTSDAEANDQIKQQGIKAYLVIKDDGTGYYAYKSDTVALRVEAIKIKYVYDEEETNKVKEISFTNGQETSSKDIPGCGYETLGLYFKLFKKTLNQSHPAVFNKKVSTSVTYTKVSSKSDLSYVEKKMGKLPDILAFELNGLTGNYLLSYDNQNLYEYYIISLDAQTMKASVNYRLRTSTENVKVENQTFTVEYKKGETENYLEIKIGEYTLIRRQGQNGQFVNVLDYKFSEYTNYYNKDSRSVSEIINSYN